MTAPRDLLKLRPWLRPLTTLYSVKFLPSRGRKPWFAKVFNIGHGPRTVAYQYLVRENIIGCQHTGIFSRCNPLAFRSIDWLLALFGCDQAEDQGCDGKNVKLHIDLFKVIV